MTDLLYWFIGLYFAICQAITWLAEHWPALAALPSAVVSVYFLVRLCRLNIAAQDDEQTEEQPGQLAERFADPLYAAGEGASLALEPFDWDEEYSAIEEAQCVLMELSWSEREEPE